MMVYIDGKFVPENEAKVSVFDRSFLYGDGLFETILLFNHSLFRYKEHIERLKRCLNFLKIPCNFKDDDIQKTAIELSHKNNMPKGMLRFQVSRGIGLRGYAIRGAKTPFMTMSTHPMPVVNPDTPQQWKTITSSYKIPVNNDLFNHKTCNKLINILAKQEADSQNVDDAILLNTDNNVVCGSSSNLFYINSGIILTPPAESGALPGVTRSVIFELCKKLGLHYGESNVKPHKLFEMDGVFLTMSSWGIIEVSTINNKDIRTSELTKILHTHYWNTVSDECKNEEFQAN